MVVRTRPLYRVAMSNLPEPGTGLSHLRASDADRDRVVHVLGEALADGRLSPVEHSERLDAVYEAKTMGELVPITHDLTPAPPVRSPAHMPSSDLVDTTGASTDTDKMIGIFGGGQRKGRWRVRRRTKAVAVFGGFDLDMTEATFDAPVVEFKVFALFGGLSIAVPEGVEVRNEAGSFLGGVSVSTGDTAPPPGAPVLVLKGMMVLGGTDIRTVKSRRK